MSEKYSTNELVQIIKNGMLFVEGSKAIIARLRAADKLCEAAKGVDWTNVSCMLNYMKDKGISWPHADSQLQVFIRFIRKAIAEYEEGK